MKKLLYGILPLILLSAVVIFFLVSNNPIPFGSGLFAGDRPPIEDLSVQKITLTSNLIELSVVNDGPDPVEVRQVIVNGGYWAFTIIPNKPIGRLRGAKVQIEYPWNGGDDQHITLISATGTTFDTIVSAAVASPRNDWRFAAALAFIGFMIGVVPVFLGLLWFPFIRLLKSSWYSFFLALSIGLLVFLGVDSLQEALEIVPITPQSLNGIGVLLLGFSISFLGLFYLSRGHRKDVGSGRTKSPHRLTAFSAAFGIGVHNLGEGLAVGSAFALGNISLGATLIIGFMIHNITEGLPIIAPLVKEKMKVMYLVTLGLLAGGPAIIGSLIGGYSYAPIWSVLFLGIGAGAIVQVAVEIAASIGRGSINRLFTLHTVAGFLFGLLVMYSTGLIAAG